MIDLRRLTCARCWFLLAKALRRVGADAAAQRVQARGSRQWVMALKGAAWVDAMERGR